MERNKALKITSMHKKPSFIYLLHSVNITKNAQIPSYTQNIHKENERYQEENEEKKFYGIWERCSCSTKSISQFPTEALECSFYVLLWLSSAWDEIYVYLSRMNELFTFLYNFLCAHSLAIKLQDMKDTGYEHKRRKNRKRKYHKKLMKKINIFSSVLSSPVDFKTI